MGIKDKGEGLQQALNTVGSVNPLVSLRLFLWVCMYVCGRVSVWGRTARLLAASHTQVTTADCTKAEGPLHGNTFEVGPPLTATCNIDLTLTVRRGPLRL